MYLQIVVTNYCNTHCQIINTLTRDRHPVAQVALGTYNLPLPHPTTPSRALMPEFTVLRIASE